MNAVLEVGVIASIARLPALRELTLTHTTLRYGENLYPLASCSELKRLTLTELTLQARPEKLLLGQIYHLRKSLPHVEVKPIVIIPDHTDYQSVLTTAVSATSFAPREIDIPISVLSHLLDTNTAHSYWTQDFAFRDEHRHVFKSLCYLPYDHNLCPLPFPFSGSPIKCPDGRARYAVSEPNSARFSDFWSAVEKLNVSLIVMVKEIVNDERYFPLEKQETYRTVTCLEVTKLEHRIQLRTLKVNDRIVQHLQIHIDDGSGLADEPLHALLKLIEESEKQNPSAATFVHCLAGVGRTGMTLACMILSQLMQKIQTKSNQRLDLEKLLSSLRTQREGMIGTEEQLTTILRFFKKLATEPSKPSEARRISAGLVAPLPNIK